MKRWFAASLVAVLVAGGWWLAFAGDPDSVNPVPQSNAAFLTDLQTYLKEEDADRHKELFTGHVVQNGLHATGAGLTGNPGSLIAYPGGARVTETASITYPDNTAACWVIASRATTGNLASFVRVAGTHYLTDCVTASQPALPADAVYLMKVTTSAGAITAVVDLRTRDPVVASLRRADVGVAGRAGRLTRLTDDSRNILLDTGVLYAGLEHESISVKRFVTGGTGTDGDPYTGWAAAIASGPGWTSGKDYILTPETYALPSEVALTSLSGLRIRGIVPTLAVGGATAGSRIKWTGATNGIMFNANGVRHLVMEHLVLDGASVSGVDGLKIDYDGVQSQSTGHITVHNVMFDGLDIGIDVGNTSNIAASEIYFSRINCISGVTTCMRIRGGNTLNIRVRDADISAPIDLQKGDLWIENSALASTIVVGLDAERLSVLHSLHEGTATFISTTTGLATTTKSQIVVSNLRGLMGTGNYINVTSNHYLTLEDSRIAGTGTPVVYNPPSTSIGRANSDNNFFKSWGNTFPDAQPSVTAGTNYISTSSAGNTIVTVQNMSVASVPATPALITANTFNYDPAGAGVLRISANAGLILGGLAGGTDGLQRELINVGSNSVTVANQHASASDVNKIITGTGADITFAVDDTMVLRYDGTTQRWRVTNTH